MSITPRGPGSGVLAPTATTLLDSLSRRDTGNTALNTVRDDDQNDWASLRDTSLDTYEALELLTLGPGPAAWVGAWYRKRNP